MSQSKSWHGALCASLVVAFATTGTVDGARAAGEPRQVALSSQAGTAVRRALLSARRRLADEPCRSILTDFTAEGGRSLQAVLHERGRTPETHLDSLVFRDGSTRPRCASQSILAFTHVGGDTIYVCAGQFSRVADRDPASADIVLIHEALHTMGLGENPPTSREITARVLERCGT